MSTRRILAILLVSILFSGCFSWMVNESARSLRSSIPGAYADALAWAPFEGTYHIKGKRVCSQSAICGTNTRAPVRAIEAFELDLSPSPLYLVLEEGFAVLRDSPPTCAESAAAPTRLSLLISSDSTLPFRPSTSDSLVEVLLRFRNDSAPNWPGKSTRVWELKTGSPLLVERKGTIVRLPVLVQTQPDVQAMADAAARRQHLWYLVSVPADIVTSPLQLLAFPFVIYVAAASHCCR